METYQTLAGDVLDLLRVDEESLAHLRVCYDAWRRGGSAQEMVDLTHTARNPVLRPSGGVVTRDAWENPAFQAMRDLHSRAAIREGSLRASDGQDPEADPLDDEWVPSVTAAMGKGISLPGLHGAIERGAVIARTVEEGGRRRTLVSRNSLAGWEPDPVRQAAGLTLRSARAGRQRVK